MCDRILYSPHDGERVEDTDSAAQLKLGKHSTIPRSDLWNGLMSFSDLKTH